MHITDTGNMRNVCELIKLYIEEYLNGSYIGCIFTQAPGKRRHPMWVFKKTEIEKTETKSMKRDKVMTKLYPEIENLILNQSTPKQPLKRTTLKTDTFKKDSGSFKKEEPTPPGFFNF